MKRLFAIAVLLFGLTLAPLPAAAALDASSGADLAKPNNAPNCIFGTLDKDKNCSGSGGLFKTIANVLIFLTGAIAVLVVIFGGFRYVLSTGEASRVKQAKDTILYGVIGLVVALLSYAIVGFVTKSL